MAGYLATVWYLSGIDVFTTHFATTGPTMLGYNVCRLLLIGYLAWIVAGTGWLAVGFFGGEGRCPALGRSERHLLHFFVGSALLHLLMFPLGLLNLYYKATALVISVPILILSYPYASQTVRSAIRVFTRTFQEPGKRDGSRWLAIFLLVAIGIVAGMLCITRALYPGEASVDAYEHYLPYQRMVMANHGTLPNDVWYHFYTAKGAGLTFLATLLSDALACQSVSFLCLLAAVTALAAIVARMTASRPWGLLAGLAAMACFPFSNPDWGAFQSHHIGACAWMVATTWMIVVAVEAESVGRWFSWMLVVVAAQLLFCPLYMVFVFPVLGVLAIGYWLRRRRELGLGFALVLAGAGVTMALLLVLNYSISGMLLENPLPTMWKFANQEKLNRWCSNYLLVYATIGTGQLDGKLIQQGLLGTLKPWPYWFALFRGTFLPGILPHPGIFPLLAGIATVAAALRPARVTIRWSGLLVIVLTVVFAFFIACKLGDALSVNRNYAFMAFYSAALLAVFWKLLADWLLPDGLRPPITVLFMGLAAMVTLNAAFSRADGQRRLGSPSRWPAFLSFATGEISIRAALEQGDGLWRSATEARLAVGFDRKIFTLNHGIGELASHSFPGLGLLTEPSRTSLGGKWHRIVLGEAAAAERELRQQGIDYFFIDFTRMFLGCMAFSPLFSPDHLAERFDLVWANQTGCVLTWRGRGAQAVPPVIVNALRQRVQEGRKLPDPYPDGVFGRLYDRMKLIYDYNAGRDYPVLLPPNLPPVKGWE